MGEIRQYQIEIARLKDGRQPTGPLWSREGCMASTELGGVAEAASVLDAKGSWHLKGGRIWAKGGEGKKHPRWRP